AASPHPPLSPHEREGRVRGARKGRGERSANDPVSLRVEPEAAEGCCTLATQACRSRESCEGTTQSRQTKTGQSTEASITRVIFRGGHTPNPHAHYTVAPDAARCFPRFSPKKLRKQGSFRRLGNFSCSRIATLLL